VRSPLVPGCEGSRDEGGVEGEDGSLSQIFLIGVQGEKLEKEREGGRELDQC